MSLWTNVDEAEGAPKFVVDSATGDTGTDIFRKNVDGEPQVLGISADECANNTTPKYLSKAGWVKQHVYQDSSGNYRYKSEVLVAMGSMSTDADSSLVDDLGE